MTEKLSKSVILLYAAANLLNLAHGTLIYCRYKLTTTVELV